MNNSLLRVYRAIPAMGKSWMASVRGLQLARWRYGPETDGLVEDALRMDTLNAADLERWQGRRCRDVLMRAVARVPHYRRLWERSAEAGEVGSSMELVRWPILDKESVRREPLAFVADGVRLRKLFRDHTSGTTGTPLEIFLSRETVRRWYALYEARTRRVHGVSRRDHWGLVGGQPVVAPDRKEPPFWVWNAGLRQLYLSAMHIADWSAPFYIDAIRRHQLKFLVGYPSSLCYLAEEAIRSDQRLPVTVVITNAEPLYPFQRAILEKGFRCRVQETYGLAEIVCMATECRMGSLHLWPEAGIVEILDEKGAPVPAGEVGRIVATGLLNEDMPLIRYDTRDLGALRPADFRCGCGMESKVLEKVMGRRDDAIVTADGRRPVLVDRIFDPPIRVREGQIVQEAIGRFRIRVVPVDGWSENDAETLRKGLMELVGAAEIRVETVARLEKTWAGKARMIVSRMENRPWNSSTRPSEGDGDCDPLGARKQSRSVEVDESRPTKRTLVGRLVGQRTGTSGRRENPWSDSARRGTDPRARLYAALPHYLRSWIASARGMQLKYWRYDRNTDFATCAALGRECWTREQWADWQGARLRNVLSTARHEVEHYREQWTARGTAGEGEWLRLEQWPVLRKEPLRKNPRAFLRDGVSRRGLWCEHTSGTTGKPVTLWQSAETLRQWYALVEARWRGWYGLSRSDRWAILGGQLVTPVGQRCPPYWVWNVPMRQLYLSTYHLSQDSAKDYLQAIRRHGVVYLWGYASALATLGRFVLDQGIPVPSLRAAISNAEPLYRHQRETIAQAFRCPVYDTYGMSEMVCGASECEHGVLHLWPDAGIYEVLKDGEDVPVRAGETGRLVCTGLINEDMPLIRYETGDRVAIGDSRETCRCGRTLPILLSVDGRSDDLIVTKDGRLVGRLDPVFKKELPIVEAQIIQADPDTLVLRVVRADGYGVAVEEVLRRSLRERVGDMEVRFDYCDSIPRSRNGKFKAVVSLVQGQASRVAGAGSRDGKG